MTFTFPDDLTVEIRGKTLMLRSGDRSVELYVPGLYRDFRRGPVSWNKVCREYLQPSLFQLTPTSVAPSAEVSENPRTD